jgi:putative transposase
VTVIFLRSGSRCGVLPGLRKQLAMQAVNEHGISIADTARQLGVTANAVSYMLKAK